MIHDLENGIYYSDPVEATDRCCLTYIEGDNYSLMVDSGNSKRHYQQFYQQLNKPETDFLILTHSHWDHSYGLTFSNCESYCCSNTELHLLEDMNLSWDEESVNKGYQQGTIDPFIGEAMLEEYKGHFDELRIKVPDIIFDQEIQFDLGGNVVIARHVTCPHCDDAVVIYCPKQKTLVIGDAACEELINGEWIDNVDKLKEFIAEINQFDYQWVIDGHSGLLSRDELEQWFKERL